MQINDRVYIDIVENGYWKDSAKGKIVRETEKFWIVESFSHHFYDHEKGWKPRRFAKDGGRVTARSN